eukprot:3834619-Prymnesium_polylepis.1
MRTRAVAAAHPSRSRRPAAPPFYHAATPPRRPRRHAASPTATPAATPFSAVARTLRPARCGPLRRRPQPRLGTPRRSC